MEKEMRYEGINSRIIFKNEKIVKFILENNTGNKLKRAIISMFDSDYFRIIESNIGKVILITGEFYEHNYKDVNSIWINPYCINTKNIEVEN